jgi:hypothetical protein
MNVLLCVKLLGTVSLELILLLFCYIEQKSLIYCVLGILFLSKIKELLIIESS